MSPEQALGTPDVGPHSDVYSLGVVAFEVLTGALPRDFSAARGPGAAEVRRLLLETEPQRPSRANPLVRGDLETVILRALAREPARRYRSALALAVLLSYSLLTPLFFDWTDWGAVTNRMLSTWGARPVQAWRDVRVLTIPDGVTQGRLGELAAIEGITEDRPALRRLHGELMKRLARAGPRVVVWDTVFAAESPNDHHLREGFAALRNADPPIEVVTALRVWPVDGSGQVRLAPAVTGSPGVRFGGIGLDRGGGFDYLQLLAQRPPAEPVPSLALEAAAAFRAPGWRTQITLPRGVEAVDVTYTRPGDSSVPPRRLERSDRVPLLALRTLQAPDDNLGLAPGDVVGLAQVLVPPPHALADLALPYSAPFTLNDAALRHLVAGKIVVIGDARAASRDLVTIEQGRRTVPGCFLVASGIEQVLRGWSITRPNPTSGLIGYSAAALVGVLIGAALVRRPLLRAATLAASAAACVALSIILYHVGDIYSSPIIAVCAMVVACEPAAFLLRQSSQGGLYSTGG
jgi:hypothetical protein